MFRNFGAIDWNIFLAAIAGMFLILLVVIDSAIDDSYEDRVFYECTTEGMVEIKGKMFTCELVKENRDE